jgi:hypothetical protein
VTTSRDITSFRRENGPLLIQERAWRDRLSSTAWRGTFSPTKRRVEAVGSRLFSGVRATRPFVFVPVPVKRRFQAHR